MTPAEFIKNNAHIKEWIMWGMDTNGEWHRIEFFDIITEKYGRDCHSKLICSEGRGWLWVYNEQEDRERQSKKFGGQGNYV